MSSTPTPHLKRVMVFIDGGYLRGILRNHFGEEFIEDPAKFANALTHLIEKIKGESSFAPYSKPEVIRNYYYDAKYLPKEPEYSEKAEYFEKLKDNLPKNSSIDLKFGRLIKSGNKNEPRQKGVDVLLSIDMVVKAFLDHYDVAILVAGDDDFLDAVNVVKDFTGKRVVGFYSPKNTSKRLIESFDYKFPRLPTPLYNDYEP